jgi:hypothetical protein
MIGRNGPNIPSCIICESPRTWLEKSFSIEGEVMQSCFVLHVGFLTRYEYCGNSNFNAFLKSFIDFIRKYKFLWVCKNITKYKNFLFFF